MSDDVEINAHLLLRISSCIFKKIPIHQESELLNLCNVNNIEILKSKSRININKMRTNPYPP